jgi:hypothetical protein
MTKDKLAIIPYLNNEDRLARGAKPNDKPTSSHHILPKSRVEKYSRNCRVQLTENFHNCRHWVNGNAIVQEALEQFYKINWPVLSDKYKKDLRELINAQDEYVYKDGIYIKK